MIQKVLIDWADVFPLEQVQKPDGSDLQDDETEKYFPMSPDLDGNNGWPIAEGAKGVGDHYKVAPPQVLHDEDLMG